MSAGCPSLLAVGAAVRASEGTNNQQGTTTTRTAMAVVPVERTLGEFPSGMVTRGWNKLWYNCTETSFAVLG